MLKAITRSARLVDDRLAVINAKRAAEGVSKASVAYYFDHFAADDDDQVLVTEEDFMQAKQELVPSVSLDELRHYECVRDTFEGTTRKVITNGEAKRPPSAQGPQHQRSAGRPRPADQVKRAISSRDKTATLHSNGRSKSAVDAHGADVSDAEDDYVVRTDRMSMNGTSARQLSSKGKGKAASRGLPSVDGNGEADVGDGDLYD